MASIDGLGSGLDTTTIIAQMMAMERLPQQRLQVARQAAVTAGDTWSRIRSAMTALQTITRSLTDPLRSVEKFTATSSDPAALGVTVGSGAVAGTTTLRVDALAKPLQLTSAALPSGDALVGEGTLVADHDLATIGLSAVDPTKVTAGTGNYRIEVKEEGGAKKVYVNGALRTADANGNYLADLGLTATDTNLKLGSATVTVAKADASTTVSQFAAAINNTRGLLTGLTIDGTSGTTLVVTGTKTGETSRAGMSGLAGLGTVTARDGVWRGSDAALTVEGVAVKRSTNTVSDLLPGLTLDLLKADPARDLTITVTSDTAGNAATVKGLVDAVNGVLREINNGSKYDTAKKSASPLTGNSGARSLTRQLMDGVSRAGASVEGLSLGALGIKVEQSGTYSFDESALTKTLAANPTGVTDLVKKIAAEVDAVAKTSLDTTGAIASGRDMADSRARSLQQRVDEWDVRLAAIERRLTNQFTNLESALGNLKSQGNWLSGQLASLPSMYQ